MLGAFFISISKSIHDHAPSHKTALQAKTQFAALKENHFSVIMMVLMEMQGGCVTAMAHRFQMIDCHSLNQANSLLHANCR